MSRKSLWALTMVLVAAVALPAVAVHPTQAQGAPSGKIVVWGWKAAMTDTLVASGVVDDFKAEYPDVEVEIVEYSPSDVYVNFPLALTAGEADPDVVLIESSHLSEIVALGGLLDLTEKVQPYIDVINAYRWPDATLDGKIYAMPWDSGPVVLYYRRDVFEKAGLPTEPEEVNELVATWDGYLDVCRTIKEETGLYCFAHNKANNYGRLYEMVLWEQGLGYYDAETGDVTVDSPENIATLELLGQFWEEDLVSDNLEWTDPWYAEFASLDAPVATLIEASWMEVFFKSWIAPGTEGLWGVARMPAGPYGGARAANDGGSTFVINVKTDNPDAAWAFVEFTLGRPESQLKLFEISGFIPSLETTYEDPIFDEGDPFFAGQPARRLYVEVVSEIPKATVYGPHYGEMNGSVSLAIQQYAAGMSAEDALTEAADEIRASIE
ncbi:MAG TPA: sugar ABC transporter substrate-binding protein [Bellilinea sp.]|nr:sugar ABC transporter substrate-binding protein [Bellilinea sp.]